MFESILCEVCFVTGNKPFRQTLVSSGKINLSTIGVLCLFFSCCFKRFRKTFVSAEKTIVSKLLFSFWQLMFCFRKRLCLPSSLPFVVRVFSLVDFGFAFHTSSNCVPAPPSVPNRHGSAIQAPPFRLRHIFPTRTAPPSKPNFCGSASASVCSAKRLFPLKKL